MRKLTARQRDRLWARNGTRWLRALWRVVRELEKELAKERERKGHERTTHATTGDADHRSPRLHRATSGREDDGIRRCLQRQHHDAQKGDGQEEEAVKLCPSYRRIASVINGTSEYIYHTCGKRVGHRGHHACCECSATWKNRKRKGGGR